MKKLLYLLAVCAALTPFSAKAAGPGPFTFYRQLDDSAGCDGSGNTNATGDYSASATTFCFSSESGRDAKLDRLVVYVEDQGAIYGQGYGAVSASALTNGITVKLLTSTGGTSLDFTGGIPIKDNMAWARLGDGQSGANAALTGGSVAVYGGASATERAAYVVNIPLEIGGVPLRVRSGWKLAITLNDDFSALIAHRFAVSGFYEDAQR